MTAPHYRNEHVTVYHGDCLDVLPELADNSVDSVVTDPPYGLDFMGKHWDTGAVAFDTTVWKQCWRVLKPGGHLLAFGGTRTHHRLTCAIEDAGFEIRDSIAWLYGSGFPKSLDVSKAIDATLLHGGSNSKRMKSAAASRPDAGPIEHPTSKTGFSRGTAIANGYKTEATEVYGDDQRRTSPATDAAKTWHGWGTALKPSHEPIVVARKPLVGTVAANVQAWGTGALNIDACRVAASEADQEAMQRANSPGSRRFKKYRSEPGAIGTTNPPPPYDPSAGRWPTNVVIDEHTAAGIDQQSGVSRDGVAVKRNQVVGSDKPNAVYGKFKNHTTEDEGYGGEGGASRFFPVFKYTAKAPGTERPTADGIAHPTVKPLDLMRWLVRLVTPPHGVVLDPFAGSGTTAEAAIHEHMNCITIEREPTYLPLIVARLSKPMAVGFDFQEELF